MTRALEVERTYDVDTSTALPSLAGLTARVGESEVRHLDATYLDTPDLRLRRARVTLRHRTGDAEHGWHLKLPTGADRTEVQVPGALEDGVPAALLAEVRGLLRGAAPVPVLRLRTTRTAVLLLDTDGAPQVEVVDDVVQAALLGPVQAGGKPVQRWREWEAELKDGDEALLDAVEQRLLTAGAAPSTTPSKAGRALPPPPARAVPDHPGSVGALLQHALRTQVDALVHRDPALRQQLPDAVHQARVAARRLRSVLKAFRPLLDRKRTDPLRGELAWFAAELGPARDTEVVGPRLRALLAAQDTALVVGPVAQQLDALLAAEADAGRARLCAAVDGDRYLALLDALEELAEDPPLRRRARRRAVPQTRRLLARAHARLEALAAGAETAGELHEVRKQAKALRYAAEVAQPVHGKRAARLAAAARALQDDLGHVQDSGTARAVLQRLGAASLRSGRSGFTAGRLDALEEQTARESVQAWPARRRRLLPRRATDWLG